MGLTEVVLKAPSLSHVTARCLLELVARDVSVKERSRSRERNPVGKVGGHLPSSYFDCCTCRE